jgi:hypothetical protein
VQAALEATGTTGSARDPLAAAEARPSLALRRQQPPFISRTCSLAVGLLRSRLAFVSVHSSQRLGTTRRAQHKHQQEHPQQCLRRHSVSSAAVAAPLPGVSARLEAPQRFVEPNRSSWCQIQEHDHQPFASALASSGWKCCSNQGVVSIIRDDPIGEVTPPINGNEQKLRQAAKEARASGGARDSSSCQ